MSAYPALAFGFLIILFTSSEVLSSDSVHMEVPDNAVIDKEYKLEYNLKANWFKALLYCRNQGMELATIETKEQQEKLVALIIQNGVKNRSFWLAGLDLAEHGLFSWASNGRPITYSNWQSTEPNNPGSCIELWTDQRWVDSNCNVELPFVCEKAITDVSSFVRMQPTFT